MPQVDVSSEGNTRPDWVPDESTVPTPTNRETEVPPTVSLVTSSLRRRSMEVGGEVLVAGPCGNTSSYRITLLVSCFLSSTPKVGWTVNGRLPDPY